MHEEKEHARKEKKESHRKHHHRRSHAKKVTAAPPVVGVTEEEEENWDANRERIERICQIPPNNTCNDCNNNGTRWASVNHGVFLCIRCSGIHRSLGVHVSKIKSTNMDKWDAAEVGLMEAIGNQKGKSLYEARLPRGMKPMTGSEPEVTLKTFIMRKYQEKEFSVEGVNEVLQQYYKLTRYGKTPRKKDSQPHRDEQGKRNVTKGPSEYQQDDAMRALYGVNAEAISKKSRKSRPVHGTFGVVNVPPDEYDERRRQLLASFYIVEPSDTPPTDTATATVAAAAF